jgi:hypothetical protein
MIKFVEGNCYCPIPEFNQEKDKCINCLGKVNPQDIKETKNGRKSKVK